jgi:hypothetical protein
MLLSLSCATLISPVKAPLGFDAAAQVLAGEEEVEGGRGNNDFGVGVAGGFVEVVDDLFYGVDRAVPRAYELEGRVEWSSREGKYILKLPPTKNWRPMIAVLLCGMMRCAGGYSAGQ